jgi:phosphate-selective porin OprO/OprP
LTSSRLIYSPVHNDHTAYLFGVSGLYQNVPSTQVGGSPVLDVSFSTYPEARARTTAKLLDTGALQAKGYTSAAFEAAARWGSFDIAGEYIGTQVYRVAEAATLKFHGWQIQSNYVLTGEVRQYEFPHGSFGRVRPHRASGAWQLSARYSYLTLNHLDIAGGNSHEAGLGLSWYANDNIRIMGNYLLASIQPAADKSTDKRRLGILGMRLQVVF